MSNKKQQPNSRDCFVCGVKNPIGLNMKFYTVEPGIVEAEYKVSDEFQSYPGIVHGGIVAALLDEITYRSLITMDQNRLMFTARLDIRYRNHVPIGQPLRLMGRAEKIKNRTASATGAIYNQKGELLAEAEAVLMNVPEEMLDGEDLETLGWKVYEAENKKFGKE